MKTLIGILAQFHQEDSHFYSRISKKYIEAIEIAGGMAIMIPIDTHHIGTYMEMCDGFLIPGGGDIDPNLYGQDICGSEKSNIDYDIWVLETLEKILPTQKPILGICRGMQILNTIAGGTLIQNLKNREFHAQKANISDSIDTISLLPESFLYNIFGRSLRINSAHHQAIDIIGEGFVAIARSLHDKTIEAIEHTSLPLYGVQWHPEHLKKHQPLFEWFLGIAK